MTSPVGFEEALRTLLEPTLGGLGHEQGNYRVVHREANPQRHTYRSEFVTILLQSGEQLRLFCKYHDGSTHRDLGHGHRGGLRYEIDIYRRVLSRLNVSLPKFFGATVDEESGETLLVLEAIENATKVTKAADWPERMWAAASWLGRFHIVVQDVTDEDVATLKRYDRDYYLGWTERARTLTQPFRDRFPWFPEACQVFEDSIEPLLSLLPTVIHGKFYAKEVLVAGGKIYPVDWESAAVAPGVIDLAMLIDGWRDRANPWIEAYGKARWPSGKSTDFGRTLDIARLYVHMRWLGDFDDLTAEQAKNPWRFNEIQAVTARLAQT